MKNSVKVDRAIKNITQKELADAVRDQAEHFVFDEKYRAFNEKFNALDDGHATERVLARIFNESEEQF